MTYHFWLLIAAILGVGLAVLRFRYEYRKGWRSIKRSRPEQLLRSRQPASYKMLQLRECRKTREMIAALKRRKDEPE